MRSQGSSANGAKSSGPLVESDDSPMRPERMVKEIAEHLPAEAMVVSDTGHSGIWTGVMMELKEPGHNFMRCVGSLGWGLPGSIGAKLALPNRPVLCFTGDGGFWYHIGELETALRHNVNLVIVVNDNRSLNQEKGPIDRAYDGNATQRAYDDLDDVQRRKSGAGSGGPWGATPSGWNARRTSATPWPAPSPSGKPAVLDMVSDVEAMAPQARERDVLS